MIVKENEGSCNEESEIGGTIVLKGTGYCGLGSDAFKRDWKGGFLVLKRCV